MAGEVAGEVAGRLAVVEDFNLVGGKTMLC